MQELVDRGFYSAEEAQRSTNRNYVTRALGVEPTVEVEVHEHEVLPDDVYLLCSDGLPDMVEDEDIHLTISTFNASLDVVGQQLIDWQTTTADATTCRCMLAQVLDSFAAKKRPLRQDCRLVPLTVKGCRGSGDCRETERSDRLPASRLFPCPVTWKVSLRTSDMARLILSLDNQVLAEYNMTKERYTIGRLPDNDVRIDNPAVSGHHSLIINILNDSFLEDLNSTNGTYVNGKLIKKHALQHGDVITIGHHQLRFSDQEERQPNRTSSRRPWSSRPASRMPNSLQRLRKAAEEAAKASAAEPAESRSRRRHAQ